MHGRLMVSAVLQSATFRTFNYLIQDQFWTNGWDVMTLDPLYQEYEAELKRHSNTSGTGILPIGISTGPRLGSSESHSPVPLADELEGVVSVQPTLDPSSSSESKARSKRGMTAEPTEQTRKNWRTRTLGCLRVFFSQILLGPLLYFWHIWLERLFLSRRSVGNQSRNDVAPEGSKQTKVDAIGAHDVHEEQVIQKWLRQGKIQRASLSWCNTFAKWIIQWTIGRHWMDNLETILGAALQLESPWKSMPDLTGYLLSWMTQRVLIAPFGTIIAFMLIPAPKRLPFLSGLTLLWNAFLCAVLFLLVPWILRSDMYQTALRDLTADLKSRSTGSAHLIDEL
ncbi:hypothetical protein F5X98DRAFT_389763 [Xylaria grammica]|nr:hypothetical protein F5X98DRAFT_389763 [Xylaria grammica]